MKDKVKRKRFQLNSPSSGEPSAEDGNNASKQVSKPLSETTLNPAPHPASLKKRGVQDLVKRNRWESAVAILTTLTLSVSWLWPGTQMAVVSGWLATFGFSILAFSSSPKKLCFLTGLTTYAICFAWLIPTISTFGNLPLPISLLLIGIFILVEAIQFLVFPIFAGALSPILGRPLGVAIGWIAAEKTVFRLFPWTLGHSQLAFEQLANTASFGGVTLITFLMLLGSGALLALFQQGLKRSLFGVISAILLIGISLAGGEHNISTLRELALRAPQLPVTVVQGKLTLEEEGGQRFFSTNLDEYKRLSDASLNRYGLIVWPETAIQLWLKTSTTKVSENPRLPSFVPKFSFISGIYSFESENVLFNSAIGVTNQGELNPIYHKRILMPFGEYLPLADWIRPALGRFRALQELLAQLSGLTPGNETVVFHFPASGNAPEFKAAPLICYEDILPWLGAEATRSGANLLVNLTNDGWFGHTVAPLQHHAIASFRAIENGRSLIRSTNSGHTAVVSPMGKTILGPPHFESGILTNTVPLLAHKTLFVANSLDLWIPLGFRLIAVLLVVLITISWVKRGSYPSRTNTS